MIVNGKDNEILDYVEFTRTTAVYPGANEGTLQELNYLIHGLTGEAGEESNYFKKILRKGDPLTYEHSAKLIDELGDVLWYATRIADALGYDLEEVVQLNVDKLSKRKENNELKDHK